MKSWHQHVGVQILYHHLSFFGGILSLSHYCRSSADDMKSGHHASGIKCLKHNLRFLGFGGSHVIAGAALMT
jgi:hypothetical protein